jgi:hypothetical protein
MQFTSMSFWALCRARRPNSRRARGAAIPAGPPAPDAGRHQPVLEAGRRASPGAHLVRAFPPPAHLPPAACRQPARAAGARGSGVPFGKQTHRVIALEAGLAMTAADGRFRKRPRPGAGRGALARRGTRRGDRRRSAAARAEAFRRKPRRDDRQARPRETRRLAGDPGGFVRGGGFAAREAGKTARSFSSPPSPPW